MKYNKSYFIELHISFATHLYNNLTAKRKSKVINVENGFYFSIPQVKMEITPIIIPQIKGNI